LNVKVNLAGYDVMLTLHGASGSELLQKLKGALAAFAEMGAEPARAARAARAAATENGNGHGEMAEETPVCAIHGTLMTKR
jgi:ribosomal protein L12E/L44/L45/RPP1/RPP2